MSSDRPLYVMDDDYIEQKYVKAEEERQKREEALRIQREADEKSALEEAEKQRKLAEAERRRKKEEQENLERLEAAKKLREAEEAKRKEQQSQFQAKLDDINDELSHLETTKSKFLSEKLALAKELQTEKESIEEPLNEIRREKEELEAKERDLILKLKQHERKTESENLALEQKEKASSNRIKELLSERRQVQEDMLTFLQKPVVVVTPVVKETPKETLNPSPTPKYPNLNSDFNLKSSLSDSSNFQPSVQIVGLNNKPKHENDLNEQLLLLDEFLTTGVLTRIDYEDARKRLFDDYNKNHPTPNMTTNNNNNNNNNNNKMLSPQVMNLPLATALTPGNMSQQRTQQNKAPSVESQLKQLDEWLQQGVIGQAEYEETQNKLLQDAGLLENSTTNSSLKNNNNNNNNNKSNINNNDIVNAGFKSVSNSVKVVSLSVTVPFGVHGGQPMPLFYQGKQYMVVVPNGLKPGNSFTAQIPVQQ